VAQLRRAAQGGANAARAFAAAQGGAQLQAARALARLTVQQRRLVLRMGELEAARDWLGVVALEHEALALARELRGTDPGLAGRIHSALGLGLRNVGEYARAREMHEQDRAMAEALGDRTGMARACGGLGLCYYGAGDYRRARELHEQDRAMCEALGDRAGVATACANLGNCYFSTGDYGRGREMYEQSRAICEALGDRAGVATA